MEADTAHGYLAHKQKVSVGESRKSSSASNFYKTGLSPGACLRMFLIPAKPRYRKGKIEAPCYPPLRNDNNVS